MVEYVALKLAAKSQFPVEPLQKIAKILALVQWRVGKRAEATRAEAGSLAISCSFCARCCGKHEVGPKVQMLRVVVHRGNNSLDKTERRRVHWHHVSITTATRASSTASASRANAGGRLRQFCPSAPVHAIGEVLRLCAAALPAALRLCAAALPALGRLPLYPRGGVDKKLRLPLPSASAASWVWYDRDRGVVAADDRCDQSWLWKRTPLLCVASPGVHRVIGNAQLEKTRGTYFFRGWFKT